MRSRYADKFNHDEDAPDYDKDVLDEASPIRAGYAELLDWACTAARIEPNHSVLELGSGTGNLTVELLPCRRLVCVDISRQMSTLARQKLASANAGACPEPGPEIHECDLLAYFDRPHERFDRVVSTYTIHHLTDDEKQVLFEHIRDCLEPGGRAVFGDLMFENAAERKRLVARWLAAGENDLVETIDDEFFWDLETALQHLRALGFETEHRRFSELSWGVSASLTERTGRTR